VSQARETGFAKGGNGTIFTVAEFLLGGCLIHVNLRCQSVRPGWKFLKMKIEGRIGEACEHFPGTKRQSKEEEPPDEKRRSIRILLSRESLWRSFSVAC